MRRRARTKASRTETGERILASCKGFYTKLLKGLQVAASPLLLFNRNKESLKVSLAEALATLALQNLIEDRRAIFDRFCKYLQQVALVVAVDQDAEAFEI